MFKQSSRLLYGRAPVDVQMSVQREADNDPRIGRAWRDGRLIFCALVGDDLIQSEDILEVFRRLPDLDAA